jgi:hypothetical protein
MGAGGEDGHNLLHSKQHRRINDLQSRPAPVHRQNAVHEQLAGQIGSEPEDGKLDYNQPGPNRYMAFQATEGFRGWPYSGANVPTRTNMSTASSALMKPNCRRRRHSTYGCRENTSPMSTTNMCSLSGRRLVVRCLATIMTLISKLMYYSSQMHSKNFVTRP